MLGTVEEDVMWPSKHLVKQAEFLGLSNALHGHTVGVRKVVLSGSVLNTISNPEFLTFSGKKKSCPNAQSVADKHLQQCTIKHIEGAYSKRGKELSPPIQLFLYHERLSSRLSDLHLGTAQLGLLIQRGKEGTQFSPECPATLCHLLNTTLP